MKFQFKLIEKNLLMEGEIYSRTKEKKFCLKVIVTSLIQTFECYHDLDDWESAPTYFYYI